MYDTTLTTLLIVSILCASITGMPVGLDDIFAGYVKNTHLVSPEKQSEIIKRRVIEENPDSGLKKVSLASLIGDLETNLYQSAITANSHVHDQKVEEKAAGPDHAISKRKSEQDGTMPAPVVETTESTTTAPTTSGESEHGSGKTTRIVIDRIAVQPHVGNDLPIIPAFQVQQTKVISTTLKDTGAHTSKLTITKANILATSAESASTETPVEKTQKEKKEEDKKEETEKKSDSTTTTTPKPTQKPIEDLKKAEAELSEKVAEIEAEPVILTARV